MYNHALESDKMDTMKSVALAELVVYIEEKLTEVLYWIRAELHTINQKPFNQISGESTSPHCRVTSPLKSEGDFPDSRVPDRFLSAVLDHNKDIVAL